MLGLFLQQVIYYLHFFIHRILSNEKCRAIFRDLDEVDVLIKDINLCAHSTVGDTCKGDSGGALMVRNRWGGYVEILSFKFNMFFIVQVL